MEEDLILTRVMWLRGLEEGVNRGEGVDSYERYIYIHGTNHEGRIGEAPSCGCVRMKNLDVVRVFECMAKGGRVCIAW